MVQFGRTLAAQAQALNLITLQGDLGAGKTTLARALLRGLGYQGKVKSPTYALVESYSVSGRDIHHFDLYRISDPEELEYLGFSDYFSNDALLLIEWPEKAQGVLPVADLKVEISYTENGRLITLTAATQAGSALLVKVSNLSG
ncbi:MAG TPA: tRNA (adenosine(37)-N6)-threonylcarbamoyltransferase complex ATPase subunit type 1 TsaE [Gammaproteobacteria bacterium]|nr:tRNA (adenosine(37)-N6)-threonylcarbamoyltransferase complex ATPase subunit type 1 TsaE [Gammaproteobacteria bacterium]